MGSIPILPSRNFMDDPIDITDYVYDGKSCIDGTCPLCNTEHPGHLAAKRRIDELLGIVPEGE